MDYNYFIGMIKLHETMRIRAYRGRRHTNPERVPNAFALLMPDILAILNQNIAKICGCHEGMAIFGLQPASKMILSNRPISLNRSLKGFKPNSHFCCTLDFMVAPVKELQDALEWDQTHSVIIDFTSGEVMDINRYLGYLDVSAENQGVLYGVINDYALSLAWTIAKLKQKLLEHSAKYIQIRRDVA